MPQPKPIQKVGSSPTEAPGDINSIVGRTKNQLNSAQADYLKRLASYRGAKRNEINKLFKGTSQDYKNAYQRGTQGVESFFKKYFMDMDKRFQDSKGALGQERESGLQDLRERYAGRGISSSSGVFQQGMMDYEGTLADRLKKEEESYRGERSTQEQSRKNALGQLGNQYRSKLDKAAGRKLNKLRPDLKGRDQNARMM